MLNEKGAVMLRDLNVIASETGHCYWECCHCKGKEIDETGFTLYCYTCDDDVQVRLIKERNSI